MIWSKYKIKVGESKTVDRYAFIPTRIDDYTMAWLEYYEEVLWKAEIGWISGEKILKAQRYNSSE